MTQVVVAVPAALAVVVHVWIFSMESLTWEQPATRRVFGMSAEEAAATRELAYNQGFYNLFLAVVLAVGTLLHVVDDPAGSTLMAASAGSMAAAAVVLVTYAPQRLRAAIGQGLFPALTLLALLLA